MHDKSSQIWERPTLPEFCTKTWWWSSQQNARHVRRHHNLHPAAPFFISLFFELYSFPPFIQLWWFNLWWWRWSMIMGIGRKWSRPLHANLTPWLERATHDCTTMTDQECKLNLSIVFSKVINSDPKACFAFITFGGVWCSRMFFVWGWTSLLGRRRPSLDLKEKLVHRSMVVKGVYGRWGEQESEWADSRVFTDSRHLRGYSWSYMW